MTEKMETTATELKNVALVNKHISLGAKMVPFAGYLMPVSYSGLIDEHLTVRKAMGVFDVSHMGEFILKGENALDLIQRVTSNDASVLTDGKIQYSCLPNDKGGIVDDLLVYRIDEKTYMLVVNASNIDKDFTRELMGLVNKHSIDNELNTADFILAQYITLCLQGLKITMKQRSEWHGTP